MSLWRKATPLAKAALQTGSSVNRAVARRTDESARREGHRRNREQALLRDHRVQLLFDTRSAENGHGRIDRLPLLPDGIRDRVGIAGSLDNHAPGGAQLIGLLRVPNVPDTAVVAGRG